MKSIYYQIVNFIQSLDALIFTAIILILFACALMCVVKFFKAYNGTQKKFEKLSKIVIAVLILMVLIFLISVR